LNVKFQFVQFLPAAENRGSYTEHADYFTLWIMITDQQRLFSSTTDVSSCWTGYDRRQRGRSWCHWCRCCFRHRSCRNCRCGGSGRSPCV